MNSDTYEPVNRLLNFAVEALAAHFWPHGFDFGHPTPESLEQLTARIEQHGRVLVSDEYCDKTIFGYPETNIAFRAWHDWVHYTYQYPFSEAGELQVYKRQAYHLANFCYRHGLPNMRHYLYAETIGQIEYNNNHAGAFPTDQRAFTLAYLQHPQDAIRGDY